DAGIGDVVAAPVGFEVVADFGVLGKGDVAVDDGAANARVAADVHVIVEDGFADFAETVDANIVAKDGVLDPAAGDDGTARDDGVNGDAHAVRVAEDELGRRVLMLPGAEGPGAVVKIEDG